MKVINLIDEKKSRPSNAARIDLKMSTEVITETPLKTSLANTTSEAFSALYSATSNGSKGDEDSKNRTWRPQRGNNADSWGALNKEAILLLKKVNAARFNPPIRIRERDMFVMWYTCSSLYFGMK